jgi:uncharacterized protein (DUF1330 family)
MKMVRFFPIALGAVLVAGVSAAMAQSQSAAKAPAAFFVAEFETHDVAAMQPYRAQVESTFKPFGGRFVARGGALVSLEGAPMKGGVVIIGFDSMAKAQAWYHSPAYAPLHAIRERAATTRAFIVAAGP